MNYAAANDIVLCLLNESYNLHNIIIANNTGTHDFYLHFIPTSFRVQLGRHEKKSKQRIILRAVRAPVTMIKIVFLD